MVSVLRWLRVLVACVVLGVAMTAPAVATCIDEIAWIADSHSEASSSPSIRQRPSRRIRAVHRAPAVRTHVVRSRLYLRNGVLLR
jgi:hypothetical protein